MDEQKKPQNFGSYLQTIRLEKRIKLEEVSNKTKIRLDTLRYIEEEDFNNLPAEVFVKGFLRSFAIAIKADEKEVIDRYTSFLESTRQTISFEEDLNKSKSNIWSIVMVSLVILGCIIALSIFLASFNSEGHSSSRVNIEHQDKHLSKVSPMEPIEPTVKPSDNRPEMSIIEETAGKEISALSLHPAKLTFTDQKKKPFSQKLSLEISVLEYTWFKVNVDDEMAKEYSVHQGDRLVLTANTGYKFHIGNATGIKMKLNGKPYKISGKSGEVVRVNIP